jgi:hypothetical protein
MASLVIQFPSSNLTQDAAKFISISNMLAGIQDYAAGGSLSPDLHSKAIEQIFQQRPLPGSIRTLDADHRRLMRIAWQTELATKVLDTVPGDTPTAALQLAMLRRISSQTLPVQVYYALFNMARAHTAVAGHPCQSHRQVHDDFASNRLVGAPGPWGASLTGDPDDLSTCLLNGRTPPDLAFNPMEQGRDPIQYLGAALRMTRRWQIESRRLDWLKDKQNRTRAGQRYKALPARGRDEIIARLRPTTLMDFVYELRRRANYESTDEYGSDVDDFVIARFHKGMLYLLDSGMLVYEAEIVRCAGKDAFREASTVWADPHLRTMPVAMEGHRQRTSAIVDSPALT